MSTREYQNAEVPFVSIQVDRGNQAYSLTPKAAKAIEDEKGQRTTAVS
jgi:hypothetical protein